LKNDGTVWAWGKNDVGQLGNGTTTNSLVPVQVKGQGGVGNLGSVVAISAGEFFSVALKSDGSVWAWGLNDVGELGNGTTTNSLVPVQVNLAGVVVAISAGEAHSLALLNDGTVWGWGDNYFGELGDGSTLNARPTPVQVLQSPGGSNFTNVKAVSAGGYFSIALKNDGTVWSWGSGLKGQLGDGRGGPTPSPSPNPIQVSVLANVQAISVGEDQSLSIRGDIKTLWAWGGNAYGQIGDGTTNDALTPVPVSGF
jgi:alpha-tubulin suppressor-like RCC1 family protein